MLVADLSADHLRDDRRQIGVGKFLGAKDRHVLKPRPASVDEQPSGGGADIPRGGVGQFLVGRNRAEHLALADGVRLPQRIVHERRQGEPANGSARRSHQIDHVDRPGRVSGPFLPRSAAAERCRRDDVGNRVPEHRLRTRPSEIDRRGGGCRRWHGRAKPEHRIRAPERLIDQAQRLTGVEQMADDVAADAPLLKAAGSAAIVNVSSELGSLGSLSNPQGEFYGVNILGYNSSKTALNAVTVSFAKALAPFGIRVNSADPGYTATDFNGHTGYRTVEQAAEIIVQLATSDDTEQTGKFLNDQRALPW